MARYTIYLNWAIFIIDILYVWGWLSTNWFVIELVHELLGGDVRMRYYYEIPSQQSNKIAFFGWAKLKIRSPTEHYLSSTSKWFCPVYLRKKIIEFCVSLMKRSENDRIFRMQIYFFIWKFTCYRIDWMIFLNLLVERISEINSTTLWTGKSQSIVLEFIKVQFDSTIGM